MARSSHRDDSLDLLRIISMLMVVCNHLFTWTGVLENSADPMSPLWLAENTLFVFFLPAVNVFVLISGFFLCTAEFKLKKLVSLWIQSACYSVGFYLFACMAHHELAISFLGIVKSCLVITMRHYWFVTAYVLLYIVFPFLNYAIHAMNKKTHALCCMVLLGVFSATANLVYIVDFSSVYGGYSFLWFCVMYIVASYVRLYIPAKIKHQKWMFLIAILCSLTICGEKYAAHIVTPHIFGTVVLDGFFYSYNSIMAVPCALALFQGFRGMEIKSKFFMKIISFFAPLTFAAYLVHGHPNFSEVLLDALNVTAYSQTIMIIPYAAICTFSVVIASCLIEWVRQQLFRVCGINKLVERVCDRIQNRVQVWLDA